MAAEARRSKIMDFLCLIRTVCKAVPRLPLCASPVVVFSLTLKREGEPVAYRFLSGWATTGPWRRRRR
jgi:hypothetical protein